MAVGCGYSLTRNESADRLRFWIGTNAPRRQFVIQLRRLGEIEVTGGECATSGRGDVMLAVDLQDCGN